MVVIIMFSQKEFSLQVHNSIESIKSLAILESSNKDESLSQASNFKTMISRLNDKMDPKELNFLGKKLLTAALKYNSISAFKILLEQLQLNKETTGEVIVKNFHHKSTMVEKNVTQAKFLKKLIMKLNLVYREDPKSDIDLFQKSEISRIAFQFKLFNFLPKDIQKNTLDMSRLNAKQIKKNVEGTDYRIYHPQRYLLEPDDFYPPKQGSSQTDHLSLDSLLLAHNQEEPGFEYLKKSLLSFYDYFKLTQFGKAGFYNDMLEFSHENDRGDFSTHASKGNALAMSFAYRFLKSIKDAIPLETITNAEKLQTLPAFVVLEIGAGDGAFCKKIFKIIRDKAREESTDQSYWQALYDKLNYHIIELSPRLIEKQNSMLNSHDLTNKVFIHPGNAIELEACDFYQKQYKVDYIISNELMDMFPPHKIIKDKDGHFHEQFLVTFINKEFLEDAFKDHPELFKIFSDNYETLKQHYKIMGLNVNLLAKTKEGYYLVPKFYFEKCLIKFKQDFNESIQEIEDRYKNIGGTKANIAFNIDIATKMCIRKKYANVFKFNTMDIPIKYIPEINLFLSKYAVIGDVMNTSHHNKTKMICPELEPYVIGLSQIARRPSLLAEAIVITIDYGMPTFRLSSQRFQLRTMGRFQSGNIGAGSLNMPGMVDLTYHVDFTALQLIAEKHGLFILITYENNIAVSSLDNPDLLKELETNKNPFPVAILGFNKNTLFKDFHPDHLLKADCKAQAQSGFKKISF
jgi:SAM-dependent MidA family methyltransferase